MRKALMGNLAASYGAKLCRVQVIPAYPITPQTQIVEELSQIVADGELEADFIKVESEHSAMAAAVGASLAGARTFTATSAQGLLLMHEVLHMASRERTPVVMANVNRAVFPGWTIWTDQNDSLSQRDTGWIQFYAADNQEVLDSIILAYRIGEELMLPVMVNLDAFVLSHTYEAVELPEQEAVDAFLPPFRPKVKLDVDDPRAFGGLTNPGIFMEFNFNQQNDTLRALKRIPEIGREFEKAFGRYYGNLEMYRAEGAEFMLITSSTIARTARIVIDELREKGMKIGLMRVRTFRPFPAGEIYGALAGCRKAFVIDRNLSFGHSGIFYEEIKAALYNKPERIPIFGFVAGLGGRDVDPGVIHQVVAQGMELENADTPVIWMGVKE